MKTSRNRTLANRRYKQISRMKLTPEQKNEIRKNEREARKRKRAMQGLAAGGGGNDPPWHPMSQHHPWKVQQGKKHLQGHYGGERKPSATSVGLKGRKRCYCGKYVHPDCFKGDGESCSNLKN